MRRRYKYGIVLLLFLVSLDYLFFHFDVKIGMVFIVLEFLFFFIIFGGLLINQLVKQTNWYRNFFIYTNQMCSNLGYRDYLIRNLDIVNVGSNPARFAFHYDDVLGENWSTGNQGLDMDFEIIKFRHSFLKRGGVVLIPIVPFSSISGYLRDKPEYCDIKYYAKFAHTLDPKQARLIPPVRKAINWVRFPLLYEPKSFLYLLHDVRPNNRLSITEMELMRPQLIEDARRMMESWLVEFNMKSIEDPLGEELIEGMNLSIKTMQEMIDFLTERDLKPVIILPPMSEPLQNYFTREVKVKLIYDFIDKIERPSVRFLDYSNEKKWQDPCLYLNSIFMNLNGRKLFTKQVLKDLNLIS